MKFNKSAESDLWYVGDDYDRSIGRIIRTFLEYDCEQYLFEPNGLYFLSDSSLDQISAKIKELNRESGIDTTSTFTSLEDR